jgi:hypothetical protein
LSVFQSVRETGVYTRFDQKEFRPDPVAPEADQAAEFVRVAKAYMGFDRLVALSPDGTVSFSSRRTFCLGAEGGHDDRLPPARAISVTGGWDDAGMPPAGEIPVSGLPR